MERCPRRRKPKSQQCCHSHVNGFTCGNGSGGAPLGWRDPGDSHAIIGSAVRGRAPCLWQRPRRRTNHPLLRRRRRRGDCRARARSSLGDRVPAGRPAAGHRAAGPHAHRRDRRQAVAGARRRAEGVRIGPGRPARHRARPRLRAEPHHLFLLRRTGQRRRPHDAGARTPGRRRHAAARRRQGDLPAGRPAFEQPAFRLPHRAEPTTATCS